MTRWFTSDLHLGHVNIIRYCRRPYPDVETMNQAILDTINDTASPEDELWILGDVAMGDVPTNLRLLRQVRVARIVIVGGNHDRYHPASGSTGAKQIQWLDRYRSAIGKVKLLAGNPSLTIDTQPVRLSHFPYVGTDVRAGVDANGRAVADRFARWRPTDNGEWLLCGHVHDAWRQSGRMINVGVDAWAGALVSQDTIVEMITTGEQYLPPLSWERHT